MSVFYTMEVALIGALAGIGWWINSSQGPVQKKPIREIEPNESYQQGAGFDDEVLPTTDHLNLYNTRAVQSFKDAHFPERTGVIAPFYRDMRTQNSNDSVKQRKLDMFTGSDPTWANKRETEALFDAKPQNIDSSGKEGNTISLDPDKFRNSLTDIQQNTIPFEQIRVGPGVGVDPKTEAADGFHPMLRVFPADGLAHKNSELTGRVNAGHVLNSERPVDPVIAHRNPPRVWDMSRRPLVEGRANATAPAVRGAHSSVEPVQCHVDGDHRTGVAYRPGGYDTIAEMTRKDDRSQGVDTLNLKGPSTGQYKRVEFDPYRVNAQHREQAGDFVGVGFHNSAIQAYPQSAPQETEKDVLVGRSNGPGPAAPVVRHEYMRCSDMQLLKESKRGSYADTQYIAGPQRTDALFLAKLGYRQSPYMSQHHKFRAQNRHAEMRKTGHAQSPYLYNHNTNVGNDASNGKKITGENNPRLDFSLAKNALQGNPYAIDPK